MPDSGWPEWFREEDEAVFVELRESLAGEDEEDLRKALKLLRFQRNLFPEASGRAVLCAAGFALEEERPRRRVAEPELPIGDPSTPTEPQILRSAEAGPSETFGPALAKVGTSPPAEQPAGVPSWVPFLVVCLAGLGLVTWSAVRHYRESRSPIEIPGPQEETRSTAAGTESGGATPTEAQIRALLGQAARTPAHDRQPILGQVDQLLRLASDLPAAVHWRLAGSSRLLAGSAEDALARFTRAHGLGCRSRELWLGIHRAQLLLGRDAQADQALRDGLAQAYDGVLWQAARKRGALSGQRALLRKLADKALEPAEVLAAELSGDPERLRAFLVALAARRPEWLERSADLVRAWLSVQKN